MAAIVTTKEDAVPEVVKVGDELDDEVEDEEEDEEEVELVFKAAYFSTSITSSDVFWLAETIEDAARLDEDKRRLNSALIAPAQLIFPSPEADEDMRNEIRLSKAFDGEEEEEVLL